MRRGFTLVEMLVVIMIIGMLMGMLIPGVMSVRESGRRTTCQQKLGQVGQAMLSYETAHEECSPRACTPRRARFATCRRAFPSAGIAELLPYLDQALAYKDVNFKLTADHPKNAAVREMSLSMLLCPSYCGELRPDSIGVSNYAACHHDVEAAIDRDNHGMFFLDSRLSSREIPDGAMYTLFGGEKDGDPGDVGWLSGTRATLRNTGTPIRAGGRWQNPSKPQSQPASPLYVGGFGSSHADGANFLFGDGAVRFLGEHIDPTFYQYLGHRADGHLLPDFDKMAR